MACSKCSRMDEQRLGGDTSVVGLPPGTTPVAIDQLRRSTPVTHRTYHGLFTTRQRLGGVAVACLYHRVPHAQACCSRSGVKHCMKGDAVAGHQRIRSD